MLSTRPLVRMVRMVTIELPLFDWRYTREMHLITKTYNIFDGSWLSKDAFYSSIGTNGTIASNGIALIRLVIH